MLICHFDESSQQCVLTFHYSLCFGKVRLKLFILFQEAFNDVLKSKCRLLKLQRDFTVVFKLGIDLMLGKLNFFIMPKA